MIRGFITLKNAQMLPEYQTIPTQLSRAMTDVHLCARQIKSLAHVEKDQDAYTEIRMMGGEVFRTTDDHKSIERQMKRALAGAR